MCVCVHQENGRKRHALNCTVRAHVQVEEIVRLKKLIPGVVAVSCGANYTNRSQGFTHGIVGLA